jgi:hypothetical protein
MAASLLITTSRRRALSTWRYISGKACRSSSRPCTNKAPDLHLGGDLSDKSPPRMTSLRLATPSRTTSLRITRQVSISQDNSPSPTSAWAQTHGSGEATNACGEANLHVTRGRQLVAMQATCPGRSLNASLTRHATITSPSTSTLPHAKLSLRHSSTLYNARRPRLRLTRGESSKYSGIQKQDQTTRGEGQESRSEQPDPATRRLLRQDIKTKLQCSLTDDDI